jgi:DNA polymerase III epsilon subunit-like protein
LCISVGYFTIKGDIRNFRVTSFGEEKNPSDFNNLLNNHFNQPQHVLCGHNAKEFDIPFLARRMIINNIAIPDKLNLFENLGNSAFDTLELWKFDYKHFTSLKLMCKVSEFLLQKAILMAAKWVMCFM